MPRRLGTLTATERRLWRAFPQGEAVDLRVGDPALDDPAQADRWPAERSVRGEVLAALLLGACPAAPGAVAVVRLTGARITGGLRLTHGQVASPFILQGCRFDGTIDLDGAVTESIDLSGSRLIMLSAYGTLVRGTLDLNDTVVTGGEQAVNADGIRIEGNLSAERATVTGSFSLINAQISGRAKFIDAKLSSTAPDGEALNAGGMRLGRSLLAQGLETRGELRMPGAHIGSSLHLNGAVLDGLGGTALHADSLTVASEAVFRSRGTGEDEQPFTALGTVRVPGAKFGNGLDLRGARLTPKEDRPALRAARIVVEGNLLLGGGLRTDGELRLTGARITGHLDLVGMASPNALLSLHAATAEGGIRDDAASWPNRLNLDGLSYGPFSDYLDAHQRLLLISRQIRRSDGTIGGFRAQPYEQLAGYYRSLGSDGEARTVLLAKQRALRAQLPWWQRISGRLLDLLVGYGYRPLRAIGWAIALLVAGSVYFAQVRPQRVSSEDTSVFNPVLYTADHLIPVIHFGQSDVWQYHGAPAVVTVVLTILGWTLGIAIAGTAGRTFTRN
ncbi:hypothetical protein [Kitasatospora sp. MAA4]|uniref:hypothetical protein n=1 Tax=Kitasatospora sp. MAA4 TaxID=3035093 RepID=UPI002475CBC4|nr:hypothetical protein [Kitasatospora sp. MAA4]